jgi:serine/threonine protein kinase
MIDRSFGPYRIVDKLGEGGMGVVFLARDERLGRLVALKTLAPGSADDPDRLRRFAQEAATASALNHPNIVTIYDVGTADGVSYIAMEHVQGVTLADLIGENGLSLQRVLEIGVQIADALCAAHRGGILHRDLKPGNIMLSDDRRVKVLDFGLAKLIAPAVIGETDATKSISSGRLAETQAGVVMGTVAYMSPEQLRGIAIGPPSDMFAFGSLLYAMVTGAPPFGKEGDVTTVASILTDEPPTLDKVRPEVPGALARIVEGCLQKDPPARPGAPEVKQVLDALWRDEQSGAARLARTASSSKRRRQATTAAIVVAVALAGLAAWRWWPAPAVESPRISVLRRLTIDDGLSAFPAVSPDGSLVAFASDRAGTGALNLWVRQLAGGDAIQLTRGSTDDTHPTFSPDGSQIAFSSDRNGGGIFVIPSLGGEPRQLTNRGRRPRYSPDGKTIAFFSGPRSNSTTDEKIFLVPAAGGDTVPFHPEFLSARSPVWSPDGKSLLFMGRRDKSEWPDDADWWIAPIEGGEPRAIGALEVLGRQDFLDFASPELWDGRDGILFSRRVADSTNVWRLALSSDRRALPSPQQVTFGTGNEREANVLPGGGLVFTNYTERLNLWALPIDADGRIGDTLEALTQGDTMTGSPSISLSGDRAVYIANRGSGNQVWVRDLRTDSVAALSPEGTTARSAVLSRDGTRAAWQYIEASGRALYTVAANGGVPAQVCAGCGLPAGWTIDNRYLLYQSEIPSRFSLLDVMTRQSRPLLAHPTRGVYSGNISIDGGWITFHAHVEDSAHGQQIHAAPLGQGTVSPDSWVPITTGEFEDDKPRWSVKGDAIYFTSLRDGYRCLWMQAVDPISKRPRGDAVSIRHFHSARQGMMFPDLSLLGVTVARDRIVFTLVNRTAGIWMGTPAPATP